MCVRASHCRLAAKCTFYPGGLHILSLWLLYICTKCPSITIYNYIYNYIGIAAIGKWYKICTKCPGGLQKHVQNVPKV